MGKRCGLNSAWTEIRDAFFEAYGFWKKTIQDTASAIFGTNAKVFLFGSRLDDALKGGDIDLYIESQQEIALRDKIVFL